MKKRRVMKKRKVTKRQRPRFPLVTNLTESWRKLKTIKRCFYVPTENGKLRIKNLVEQNEKLNRITYVKLTKLSEREIVSFSRDAQTEEASATTTSVQKIIRKTERKVLQAKKDLIKAKIISGIEDGLKVVDTTEKGKSVIATKKFERGEFVAEYSGELIDGKKAKVREAEYAADESIGCYMFYFSHNDAIRCIDATEETPKLGRLINHCKKGNLSPKRFVIDDKPHIIFIANREINSNEELLYDYGDRRRKVIAFYPFLAT